MLSHMFTTICIYLHLFIYACLPFFSSPILRFLSFFLFYSNCPIQSVYLIVSQNPHKSTSISYTLANELYQQPQLADLSSQFNSVQFTQLCPALCDPILPPSSNWSTILPLEFPYYISSFVKTVFFNLETCKIFSLHLPPYQSLSLVAQLVKNPPAMQETPVRFLSQEYPLEKGQATCSSILGLPQWFGW